MWWLAAAAAGVEKKPQERGASFADEETPDKTTRRASFLLRMRYLDRVRRVKTFVGVVTGTQFVFLTHYFG